MISSTITNSRIGNAMFQIAAAYALAAEHHDFCAFSYSPLHEQYRDNILRKVLRLKGLWNPAFEYEEKQGFHYHPIPYHSGMLLRGFFQSEKYFISHRESIIRLFKEPATFNSIRWFDFHNSVSIHVRRGDYLKYPESYPLSSMDYYRRALAYIEERYQIDHIYVLSDDVPWCREHFNDVRVRYNTNEPDYIDLYTMAKCEHNITANSSFSWWGSYLNENPDKIVCTPSVWEPGPTPDIYYTGVKIIES